MKQKYLDLYLNWEAKAKLLGILGDYSIIIKNKNSEDIKDTENNVEDIILTRYKGNSKNPIIPPVSRIGDNAFKSNKHIENIIIPETVRIIGEMAFGFCNNLKTVEITGELRSIRHKAFYKCGNLETIRLNSEIVNILSGALYGCESLKKLDIPDKVVHIGDRCFGYTGLKYIKLPESVHDIGYRTFIGCDNLEVIMIESKDLQIHGNVLVELPKLKGIITKNYIVYNTIIKSLPEKYKHIVKLDKEI